MAKILRYRLFLVGQAFNNPACNPPTVLGEIFYGIVTNLQPNPTVTRKDRVCPNGAAFTWTVTGYPQNPTGFVGTPTLVRVFLDATCDSTDDTYQCSGQEGNICCISKALLQSLCKRLK